MVDCKINPNAVLTKENQLPLKWRSPKTHFLGADLLNRITMLNKLAFLLKAKNVLRKNGSQILLF